jgi:hypothetical protein
MVLSEDKTNSQECRPAVLIERLTLVNIFYIILVQRNISFIAYIGGNTVNHSLLEFLKKIRLLRNVRIKKLIYGDFRRSFNEIFEETHFHANDRLFEKYSRSIYLAFGLKFLPDRHYELAVRQELFNRYTLGRVRCYIFLKKLSLQYNNIVLIPIDNEDIPALLSPEYRTGNFRIPAFIRYSNVILDALKNMAYLFISFGFPLYLLFKGLVRGISFAGSQRKRYDVALDLQKIGLKRDRGLDNEGNFFLYDATPRFSPQNILHIVRDELEDEEAQKSLEKFGAPYIEVNHLKTPAGYFFSRLFLELFLTSIVRFPIICLMNIRTANYRHILAIPIFAVIKMKTEAEILYEQYDIGVFIARDEYSPFHIVRTIVANSYHNRTLGFQWADYFIRGIPLNYVYMNRYLVCGEVYIRNHAKAISNCICPVIGYGAYWADRIYRWKARDFMPEIYRKIKNEYCIVAIMGSTFSDELDVTKAHTIRFYQETFDIVRSCNSAYSVIKPKSDELDAELSQMVAGHERVCMEKNMWTYKFLLIPDLIICIGDSTIGIESLMIGKRVIFYDVVGNSDDLYSKYSPFLVARSREDLAERVRDVIVNGRYIEEGIISNIIRNHCYKFDGKVMERFKEHCSDLLSEEPTGSFR